MKKNELKIAGWAKAERRRQIRAERRVSFFANVRFIFILLLFATIVVFATNRQEEVQHFLSAKIRPVMQKLPGSNGLRAKALKYEKEVDQINQPDRKQP